MAQRQRHPRVATVLRKIYYDPAQPGSLGGVRALYRNAKKVLKNLTQKQVEEWLSGQDAYTLHRKAVTRFKTRKFLSRGINDIWQIDLADLSSLARYNKSVKYLLVCIDIFSRKGYVYPLKNKKSDTVLFGFKTLLNRNKIRVRKLHSDAGTEFHNYQMREYLKSKNIVHYNTQQTTKAAICERFIRTLKNKIYRYLTSRNTLTYLPVLDDIVEAYNKSTHSALGVAPDKVNKSNEKKLWKKQYEGHLRKSNKTKYKFQVGDHVRVSKYKTTFSRGFTKSFTDEIFRVMKRVPSKPPTYILEDLSGDVLKGSFYEAEMVKVKLS